MALTQGGHLDLAVSVRPSGQELKAVDDRGNELGVPIRNRYPLRLAPAPANDFREIYAIRRGKWFIAAGMLPPVLAIVLFELVQK